LRHSTLVIPTILAGRSDPSLQQGLQAQLGQPRHCCHSRPSSQLDPLIRSIQSDQSNPSRRSRLLRLHRPSHLSRRSIPSNPSSLPDLLRPPGQSNPLNRSSR